MTSQINKQREESKLNSWFVAILWVKITFTTLSVIGRMWKIFTDENYYTLLVAADVMLAICAIIGAYWLSKARKKGFYMIVGVNVVLAAIVFYQYTQITTNEYGALYDMARRTVLRGVWISLGQIALLMLLMLLKDNGKNAYQVIWGCNDQQTKELDVIN